MADKKKENIFKRIATRFVEVRQELKRVIWPSKEKLIQTSAIVFAVIVAFTVILTMVSQGGTAILDKVGFYNQVIETTTVPTAPTTIPVETTEGSDETTAEGETTAADETTETEEEDE